MILQSRAQKSINGTILQTKTGDDIVAIPVLMSNAHIARPKRYLEDENRIREMRDGSRDVSRRREKASSIEVNVGIG